MQTAPTQQVPSLYRKKIGDIVVTSILDGVFHANTDLIQGISAEAAKDDFAQGFRPGSPDIWVNCFLINTADKLVLVDTGTGGNEMFDGGRLPAALNAAGVSPDAIDIVLMTHLHPDHAGGLATGDGRPVFANAELIVHDDEVKFWLETENPPAEMKPFFDSTRASVAPYRDRLRRIMKGDVVPGIVAEPLPGHTPGHTGFHVQSGSDSLLIWADIVHLPHLQARHPEVYLAFDVDPDLAKANRRRIFDKVATDRLLIAGSHMDFPTFAHLERATEGYAFIPEVWRPTL